jgi:hypothetical protein
MFFAVYPRKYIGEHPIEREPEKDWLQAALIRLMLTPSQFNNAGIMHGAYVPLSSDSFRSVTKTP